jgi:putative Mn2+ efflux pump MntP
MSICSGTKDSCASCVVSVPVNYTMPPPAQVPIIEEPVSVSNAALSSMKPILDHYIWEMFPKIGIVLAGWLGTLVVWEGIVWGVALLCFVVSSALLCTTTPKFISEFIAKGMYVLYLSSIVLIVIGLKFLISAVYNKIYNVIFGVKTPKSQKAEKKQKTVNKKKSGQVKDLHFS